VPRLDARARDPERAEHRPTERGPRAREARLAHCLGSRFEGRRHVPTFAHPQPVAGVRPRPICSSLGGRRNQAQPGRVPARGPRRGGCAATEVVGVGSTLGFARVGLGGVRGLGWDCLCAGVAAGAGAGREPDHGRQGGAREDPVLGGAALERRYGGVRHLPLARARGAARRIPRLNPGADGTFGTGDDVRGSAGVVRRDATGTAISDSGVRTSRARSRRAPRRASSAAGCLPIRWFWDGRAVSQFRDPLTNAVAIASGGALENQSPRADPVECRDGAGRPSLVARQPPSSRRSRPMANRGEASRPTWPARSRRIPAIHRYSRRRSATRRSRRCGSRSRSRATSARGRDQTPWDRFQAGDNSALSASQQQGLAAFKRLELRDLPRTRRCSRTTRSATSAFGRFAEDNRGARS